MRDDEGEARSGDAGEAIEDDEPNEFNEDDEMTSTLREDAPAGRGGSSFDPTPYLRQLRGRGGGQDYLDVKWRLLWLRREHPDAEILTEHVQIDQTAAIFKATVILPTGGKATGYGSETAADFGDFIEKAETKAIGRALNALGYGAQFGERAGEEGEPFPQPAAVAPAPAPSPRPPAAPARGQAPAPAPSEPAGAADRAAPPIDIAAGRARAAGPRPETRPGRAEPRARAAEAASTGEAADQGSEPELADYSWSAFWPWARGLGLNGPKAVEALIGRATAGLTPAELRDLIVAARGDA